MFKLKKAVITRKNKKAQTEQNEFVTNYIQEAKFDIDFMKAKQAGCKNPESCNECVH